MAVEKLWLDRYEEAGACCGYCGKPMLADVDSFMSSQLDHLVPTKKGGPDTPENKVLACFVCNNLKGDFDPRVAGLLTKDALVSVVKAFLCDRRAQKARDLAAYQSAMKEPNKAPEPTPRPVTICAAAQLAPGRVVAHL